MTAPVNAFKKLEQLTAEYKNGRPWAMHDQIQMLHLLRASLALDGASFFYSRRNINTKEPVELRTVVVPVWESFRAAVDGIGKDLAAIERLEGEK